MKTHVVFRGNILFYFFGLLFFVTIILHHSNSFAQGKGLSDNITLNNSNSDKITYTNPRVYIIDYSFELVPDPAKIDRTKDLKLWIPIPREWDSQRAVKIVSAHPLPHEEYEDPEHGNRMLFWDFSQEPEKPTYKAKIRFRFDSYEVHAEVDPRQVGSYDKASEDYILYTGSTNTISITPEIIEMAKETVGDEKNPYIKAERIFQFVIKKMRFAIHRHKIGVGTKCLLDFPITNNKTGEIYYEGSCEQYSALFIALCRAVGIPARTVAGFIGWSPDLKEEDLRLFVNIELGLSPDGLAAAQHYISMGLHTWAEIYIPNYGWIPADPQGGTMCNLHNMKLIISKARDVQIGPKVQVKDIEGYGTQWILLNNGRVDMLRTGIFNISKVQTAKVKLLHYSKSFPIDDQAY